jgi:hypothetical protein
MSREDSGDANEETGYAEETDGADAQDYDSGGSALEPVAESEEAIRKTRRRLTMAATGSTSGLRCAAASHGRCLSARGAAGGVWA